MREPESLDYLWPPKMAGAIFDFDGTIADTAHIWHDVDLTFMERRGITYTPDYSEKLAALGFAQGALYTIERYGLDERPEDICQEWTDLSAELYRAEVVLRPGVERYIKALKDAGVKVALATTNLAEVLTTMEHIDPNDLFDACVYGPDVSRSKDFPDIYHEAARRLGLSASECVVFEDIAVAAASAKRAGAIVCGVRSSDPRQNVEHLRTSSDLWLESWEDIALD